MSGAVQSAVTAAGRGCVAALALALVLHGSTKRPPARQSAAPAPPEVTDADLARGYRLVSVATNAALPYGRPARAAVHRPWGLRGAYEDRFWLGLGDFAFPLGTGAWSRLSVSAWGEARPAPGRDASASVSAQLVLYPSGDFLARSNGVERAYRRVDPFDWDGDGIPNGDDPAPRRWDGDFLGQPGAVRARIARLVGSGVRNGRYRLRVTLPDAPARRTLGGDYGTVVSNLVREAFTKSDGKNVRLWPNLLPLDNEVNFNSNRNFNAGFSAPGLVNFGDDDL